MITQLLLTGGTAPLSLRPDSLGGAPHAWRVMEPFTASQGGYRTVPIEELFGPASEQILLPHGTPTPFDPALTSGFGVLVLLLVALYAWLLYRHAGDVRQLLARALQDRTTEERLYEDSAGSFPRLIRSLNLLGVVALAAAVVRLGGAHIPPRHVELMPHTAALLWSLLLMASFGLMALYQRGIAAATALLTFTQPLFERLAHARSTCLALLTLLALPPMAFWLLSAPDQGRWWFYMILIELIVSLILYLQETYTLFLSKKVSILHWILYLCTVEIFPLSLLGVLAGRYL